MHIETSGVEAQAHKRRAHLPPQWRGARDSAATEMATASTTAIAVDELYDLQDEIDWSQVTQKLAVQNKRWVKELKHCKASGAPCALS